jgi:chitin disaccharide deacetylase
MVGAPAAADAVARARRLPRLRVGLHIVLADGRPTLPPERIPDLVDTDGCFRNDMVKAGIGFFVNPKRRRQLAAEIGAQFEAYRATGLALDHANAHKHFHLHPTIAGLMLDTGRRYGLSAMRVPFEPARIVAIADPDTRHRTSYLVASWAALLRWRLRRRGIAVPDQIFGLAWSGGVSAKRLRGLLEHLPDGTTEIYLHPATAGDFKGAVPHYRYADELAALIDPAVRAAAEASGARLCGFADLGAAGLAENS